MEDQLDLGDEFHKANLKAYLAINPSSSPKVLLKTPVRKLRRFDGSPSLVERRKRELIATKDDDGSSDDDAVNCGSPPKKKSDLPLTPQSCYKTPVSRYSRLQRSLANSRKIMQELDSPMTGSKESSANQDQSSLIESALKRQAMVCKFVSKVTAKQLQVAKEDNDSLW